METSLAQLPITLIAESSIPAAPISALVLSFFIYSVGGWVWESTVCSLMNDGRFTNSGFLLGPVCPIYGVGALVCWLFLRYIPGVVELFFVAGLVCCGLEWLVGLALEAATGARFWNYDDKPFNIQGRVCLYGFLLFGVGAVAICRLIEPAILGGLSAFSGLALCAVATVLCLVLGADLVFAMASWRRLSAQLESLRTQMALRLDESMGEASERMLDVIPEPVKEGAAEVYERGKSAAGAVCDRTAAAASGARERAAEAAERTREAAESAAQRARAAKAGLGQASELLRESIQARVASEKQTRAASERLELPAIEKLSLAEAEKHERMVADEQTRITADEKQGRVATEKQARVAAEKQTRVAAEKAERPEWLSRATESLVNSLGKRDLRFFRAFPRMSFKRYDNVIKRANLRERVSELFARRKG